MEKYNKKWKEVVRANITKIGIATKGVLYTFGSDLEVLLTTSKLGRKSQGR